MKQTVGLEEQKLLRRDASFHGQQLYSPTLAENTMTDPYYHHGATETANTQPLSQSFIWKFPFCKVARYNTLSDAQEKKP